MALGVVFRLQAGFGTVSSLEITRWGDIMLARDAYLDRVTTEVEEVASRVAQLKGRFAGQKVSVKMDHYWELDYVRRRFAEFKRRVQHLEDADELELPRLHENVDAAWKELLDAVDTLMTALH